MAARKKESEAGPGRPSSFKPEFTKQAEKLCLLGATDREIADFFEVDVRTVYRWKAENAEFCQAIKAGKEVADDRVERSLFQRAVGYEQEEVKIFMPSGAESPVYAPFTAKIAPETTAAIFWLKNRRPAEWRDRVVQEITGKDGGPIQTEELNARELIAGRIAGIASRIGTESPSGKPN
jgi:hypothetical protein